MQGGVNVIARPLGKVTSVAIASDRVYIGTADSSRIDVYALDGRRLLAVRVSNPRRATTATHYDRAVDGQVAYFAELDLRQRVKKSLLTVPMPKELPPYSALLVDPAQLLWAVLSTRGDPDTRLQALSADGKVIANVRIPIGMTVFEVGADYILGAYDDDDGEPHVAVYRLRRAGR